jgi:LPXTG-motif cell wall-anchored protein
MTGSNIVGLALAGLLLLAGGLVLRRREGVHAGA